MNYFLFTSIKNNKRIKYQRIKGIKSQVTYFLIFLILILFILLITTINKNSPKTRLIVDENVKQQILSCLDDSIYKTFDLISKQGIIFKDQFSQSSEIPQNYPDFKYNTYQNTKIIYGIKPLLFNSQRPAPPGYPLPGKIQHKDYFRLFGNYPFPEIPKLCNLNKANKYDFSLYKMSCPDYAFPRQVSFQDIMEGFMIDQFKQCIKNIDKDKYNIQIKEDKLKLSLIFQDGSTLINLVLPVRQELTNILKIYNFTIDFSIRFSYIYDLARSIINHETSNLFFNPMVNTSLLKDCKFVYPYGTDCIKEMNYYIIRDINQKGDDLLIINDTKSNFKSKSYVYRFIIANRNPVLDLISKKDGYMTVEKDPDPEDDALLYNEGTKIIFKPKIYDPDNDSMIVLYKGYRTNEPIENQNIPCGIDSLTNTFNCLHHSDGTNNNKNYWQDSEIYKQNRVNAEYNTIAGIPIKFDASDLGYHLLRIVVQDSNGLKDFQVVKVLVNDYPRPNITYFKASVIDGKQCIDVLRKGDSLIIDNHNTIPDEVGINYNKYEHVIYFLRDLNDNPRSALCNFTFKNQPLFITKRISYYNIKSKCHLRESDEHHTYKYYVKYVIIDPYGAEGWNNELWKNRKFIRDTFLENKYCKLTPVKYYDSFAIELLKEQN